MDSSDSDRDSTTVSYSLEDERIREIDDSMEYRRDDSMGEERPRPHHDDKLPSYDEVVDEHKVLPGIEGDPAPEDDISLVAALKPSYTGNTRTIPNYPE